jgi:hypothetical protein
MPQVDDSQGGGGGGGGASTRDDADDDDDDDDDDTDKVNEGGTSTAADSGASDPAGSAEAAAAAATGRIDAMTLLWRLGLSPLSGCCSCSCSILVVGVLARSTRPVLWCEDDGHGRRAKVVTTQNRCAMVNV